MTLNIGRRSRLHKTIRFMPFMAIAMLVILFIASMAVAVSAVINPNPYTWDEVETDARVWYDIKMSDDGTKLIAYEYPGSAYISSDGGLSWDIVPDIVPGDVRGVGISRDGSRLAVVGHLLSTTYANGEVIESGQPSYVMLSDDFGGSWYPAEGSGLHYWSRVAFSEDGSTIVAAHDGMYAGISISRDGGETWEDVFSLGEGVSQPYWRSLSVSADANEIIATGNTLMKVMTRDGGETWSDIPIGLEELPWTSSAISKDGSRAVILAELGGGLSPGVVFASSDNLQTWQQLEIPATLGLGPIAMSADGRDLMLATILTASFGTDYIYTSNDFGETWVRQDSAGARSWAAAAITADGNKIVVGASSNNALGMDGGPLFIAQRDAVEDDSDHEDPNDDNNDDQDNDSGGGDTKNDNDGKNSPKPNNSNSGTNRQGVASPSAEYTPTSTPTVVVTVGGSVLISGAVLDPLTTFSGSGAAAGGLVVVTVHSDPVECRTYANERGDWECTLSEALEPGAHTVQIAMMTDSGMTQIGPFSVTVADDRQNGDEDIAPVADTDDSNQAEGDASTNYWPYVMGGIGGLVLIGIVFAVVRASRQK